MQAGFVASVLLLLAPLGCAQLFQTSMLSSLEDDVSVGACSGLEERIFEAERWAAPSPNERARIALARGRCAVSAGQWALAHAYFRYARMQTPGSRPAREAQALLDQLESERPVPSGDEILLQLEERTRTWEALPGFRGIGLHDPALRSALDFGPSRRITLCVLHSPETRPQLVEHIASVLNGELATYGLEVDVAWSRAWEEPWRGAVLGRSLVRRAKAALVDLELEPPCDRLLLLAHTSWISAVTDLGFDSLGGRSAGGFVEDTGTRGLVFTELHSFPDSAAQLLLGFIFAPVIGLRLHDSEFTSPFDLRARAVHEMYHMLGCTHRPYLSACYARIARLKRAKKGVEPGFFPAFTLRGYWVRDRAAAYAANGAGRVRWFAAAWLGDLVTLRQLRAEGMEVDACSADRVTALLYATAAGRPEAVAYLLDEGASEQREDDGTEALIENNRSFAAEADPERTSDYERSMQVLEAYRTAHPAWSRIYCTVGRPVPLVASPPPATP